MKSVPSYKYQYNYCYKKTRNKLSCRVLKKLTCKVNEALFVIS